MKSAVYFSEADIHLISGPENTTKHRERKSKPKCSVAFAWEWFEGQNSVPPQLERCIHSTLKRVAAGFISVRRTLLVGTTVLDVWVFEAVLRADRVTKMVACDVVRCISRNRILRKRVLRNFASQAILTEYLESIPGYCYFTTVIRCKK